MKWLSEIADEHRERQAQGPVQHGHLSAHLGGKVADEVFVGKPGMFARLRKALRPKAKHAGLSLIQAGPQALK